MNTGEPNYLVEFISNSGSKPNPCPLLCCYPIEKARLHACTNRKCNLYNTLPHKINLKAMINCWTSTISMPPSKSFRP